MTCFQEAFDELLALAPGAKETTTGTEGTAQN